MCITYFMALVPKTWTADHLRAARWLLGTIKKAEQQQGAWSWNALCFSTRHRMRETVLWAGPWALCRLLEFCLSWPSEVYNGQ